MKNIVMDSQLLSSLMGCERLADFKFNLNLVPISGPGDKIELGRLFHKMIEQFNIALRDKKGRTIAYEIGMAAGHKFIAGDADDIDEYPGITNASDEQVAHLLDTFDQYIDFYKNDDSTAIIDVEKVFGKVIYEDEEIRLLWKCKVDVTIDTVDGVISKDYKTMSQRRETLSLNNQFMGQCVTLGTNYVLIDKVGLQKTLKPEEKFVRVPINYSRDRLVEWVQIAVHYAYRYLEYVERGYPIPNFSHCDKWGNCIFKTVCSADRSMREDELRHFFKVGKPWDIRNEED